MGSRSTAGFLRLVLVILISLKFGVGHETDAYFIAQSVLLFFYALGDGVINLTFIPVFLDYKKNRGESEAWDLANVAFTLMCAALLLISLCIYVFAPTIARILAPGFSEEALSTCTVLLRVISPVPLLAGLSFIPTAIFYSHRSFLVPSITGLLYGGGAIFLTLLLADAFGVLCVPLGSVIGITLQGLILLYILKKKRSVFNLSWNYRHAGVKKVCALTGPRLAGFGLAKANIMVDRFFASRLGEGYVSCLTYAQRAIEIPSAILATMLGRVLVPKMSEYVASGAKDELCKFFSMSIAAVGFVTIPLAIIFFMFGTSIIGALFQRGAFNADNTYVTSTAFLFYDIGFVATCFNAVLLSMFFALQDAVVPLRMSIVTTILNVICDMVFMIFLGLGGIALASSLIAILRTCLLLGFLRKKIASINGAMLVKALGKICLASGLMGFVLWLMSSYSGMLTGRDSQILGLGLVCVVGLVTYSIACVLLRVREFGMIIGLFLRKGRESSEIV